MSFASIKKRKSDIAKLKDKVNENAGGGNRDERFWRPSYDKDTFVGTSLIRFLPRYDENGEVTLPWVSWKEFYFTNKANQKYNYRSLTTLGKEDPVANLNKVHWSNMSESQKEGAEGKEARKRNVRMQYVANIVVLDDPRNPENNGKVFLYRFGNQIKKILEKAWFPEYEDQTPVEFFDWDEGANLRIRSKKADFGKMPTFEDSVLEGVSPLAEGRQEVQEALYNAMHDLAEFESEDNYKTYEELEKAMLKVLGVRYVSNILGEDYTPEQAAAAGGNPFDADKEDDNSAKQEKVDEPKKDPFKEAEAKSTSEKQVDPFKESESADGGTPDPFANLDL